MRDDEGRIMYISGGRGVWSIVGRVNYVFEYLEVCSEGRDWDPEVKIEKKV